MIYDCFTFFKELDLLEIRLNELASVVDFFVIVEARERFDLQPKPLYFHENQHRFDQFKDKIIYIALNKLVGTGLESRGVYQHNQIMRGLEKAQDTDLIIISDSDEIVKAEKLRNITFTEAPYRPVQQPMYIFHLDWLWTTKWHGSAILTYEFLKNHCKTPRQARLDRYHGRPVIDGGWHFSQIGTEEDAVIRRQNSYHTEYLKVEPDEIRLARKVGQLWMKKRHAGRISTRQATPVPITIETHPKYLVDNIEKFSHLIGGKLNV